MSESIHEDCGGEKLRSHYESLCRQEQELQQEFPDFRLSDALKDPDFVRLTAPELGVTLRCAFYALNREKLDAIAQMKGAESVKSALSKTLSSNQSRPREMAEKAAAELKTDYRSMSHQQRSELKRQINKAAAFGKKIYP